jgi:putative methyltransferase (TIGR04325 family)
LHFSFTAEEAAAQARPDVVLLSGVLQFLEEPYQVLDRLTSTGARYMILDRTPFSPGAEERLTVQQVSPEIYEASYACRIFSYDRMLSSLTARWELLTDFPSPDGWAKAGTLCFRYGGLLLRRRP